MTNSILYSEINLVSIMILSLLCFKVRKSMFLQEERRLFFMVALLSIFLFAMDSVWIFVNNSVIYPGVPMNWLLNAIYYILTGFLGYYWFAYSETVQKSAIISTWKYRVVAMIPATVLFVLTITSYWTGWLFYIDDHNIYHRGPAYWVQLLTSYGYIIYTAIKAFFCSFQKTSYQRKRELRTLSFYVVPTIISGTLQIFFPTFPILCVGNTFGILYVFLSLQEQLVSVDSLTRLNNRNQLNQYLSMKLAHVNESKSLYLMIMDVDYFKSVNDQYGHIEGDRALRYVADCLMKACHGKNHFLARYGGDEFVMICELEHEETVTAICKNIRNEMKKINTPYQLSVSIGYAKYSSKYKNQQEFISRADKALYEVKKSR